MQRFGAVPWSGDINATFASLELQIRTGLQVGMAGVPHWGTDTGGFYRVGANDAELFVRWFQFSAFCSIFRGHGFVWREHLPWSHGDGIEKICRNYLELRSRLMPYTYTLAWQARSLGLPTMRPLVLNYPNDPAVWDLGTQYLWGDDILVAPVTRKGATQWTIYLPAGTWHDYWTHETYHGSTGVTVAAPLDRLPLFVRGGAIIPQGPVMQYDGERSLDELTLLVYPEGEASFSLYEDDGLTNAYRDGSYAETRFTCTADAAGAAFHIDPPKGKTSLLPANRRYLLKLRTSRVPAPVLPPTTRAANRVGGTTARTSCSCACRRHHAPRVSCGSQDQSGETQQCSDWQTFGRVVLPLIRVPLLVLAAITFAQAYGQFVYPLTLLNRQDLQAAGICDLSNALDA